MLRGASSHLSAVHKNWRTALQPRDVPSHLLSTSVGVIQPKHPPLAPRNKSKISNDSWKKKHEDSKFAPAPKGTPTRPVPKERLLHPYDLSRRLKKLCDDGMLDQAVSTLKDMPLDSQNHAVWNTVLRALTEAYRFGLAYETYIDMKRRGFIPNFRTYSTLFGGYSNSGIRDWEHRTKQVELLATLHNNYLEYAAEVREREPSSPELSTAPTRAYLRILGYAGDFQRMFDVFNAMDKEGPLAPDQSIYRAMLQGIATRKIPFQVASEARAALRLHNASQTKLIWRQFAKYMEKTPGVRIEPQTIGATLFALSQGSQSDQLLAFDIVRDYLGLAKPGETPKPSAVAINNYVFAQVLHLCHGSQRYRLAVHFFRQMMDRERHPGEERLIGQDHVEIVLRSYASLSMTDTGDYEANQALELLTWLLKEWAIEHRAAELQPHPEHFDCVLSCCYRGGSWTVAARTFELLTGYSAESFTDEGAATWRGRPAPERDTPNGRRSQPGITSLSHLVRTAVNSGEAANMRQCLRMVDCAVPNLDRLLAQRWNGGEMLNTRYGVRNNVKFYSARLAKDIIEIVDKAVPKGGERSGSAEEQQQWLNMRTVAKRATLLRDRESKPGPAVTPFLAEDPLGGGRSLASMDSFVEYDMTVRRTSTTKSRR